MHKIGKVKPERSITCFVVGWINIPIMVISFKRESNVLLHSRTDTILSKNFVNDGNIKAAHKYFSLFIFYFFSVHQNKKRTVSHRGSIQMRLSVILTNSIWGEVIYARYPKRLLWSVLAWVMKELSLLSPYVTGSLPCWTMLGTDFF